MEHQAIDVTSAGGIDRISASCGEVTVGCTDVAGIIHAVMVSSEKLRAEHAALQETAARLGTPEFQFYVISLAIQRETGGNLAETLSNLADVLRKRAQMKLKIKAMSSESKASAYIVGSLPFVVFTLVWFINPTYMGGFFTDDPALGRRGRAPRYARKLAAGRTTEARELYRNLLAELVREDLANRQSQNDEDVHP